MSSILDELSEQQIKFIIRALEFQLHYFNQRLEADDLDEDEEVYIRNDAVTMQETIDHLKTVVSPPYYSALNVCE